VPNPDPFCRFRDLFDRARSLEAGDPRAAALATADASGRPSVRFVLLQAWDAEGFVFFTDYGSRKARDLEANPRAALCCSWPAMAAQVRIEGLVVKLTAEESDESFASRPRPHQVAAWATRQSAPLPSRRELLERYHEADTRLAGGPIPRPPGWGGYRLHPETIEFWHGFENRMHDRIVYTRTASGWSVARLDP
jgi:pyridoxamine 5'-phosphate oxidase